MRIVHPQAGEVEFDMIRAAIVLGKRTGWASGKKPDKLPDGTKHYENRHGDLLYTDDFIGEQAFIGREMIRHIPSGVPLWGMNYDDIFWGNPRFNHEDNECLKKETFGFLKEMLLSVPSAAPFRGPLGMSSKDTQFGRLLYLHEHKGYDLFNMDLRQSSGMETIQLSKDNRIVCAPFTLNYNVRLLVPDAYVLD